MMFEEPKQRKSSLENRARYGVPTYGNGWPGIHVRWCTGQLKTHLVNKEVNRLKADKAALHYVGIAADEAKRCKNDIYPLVMWGITEADALQVCYDRALILAVFIGYTTAPPAGAALSNGSGNCVNCADITRNCGRG